MEFPRLPIEKFDENGLLQAFYVNSFSEHLTRYHSDINHPHKHDFYITVLFTKGNGTHAIDFNSYPVHPGSVFFLQPEQIHDWQFDEAPEGWIFFHSSDFYTLHSPQIDLQSWPFFKSHDSSPILNLDSASNVQLEDRFKELFSEYKFNDSFAFLKIAAIVQLIYSDLARIYLAKNPKAQESNHLYRDHFKRFKNLLESNYLELKTANFYAEQLGMTAKHLLRVCRFEAGKSTSQLIAERTILEAKRKLISEAKSLSQISEDLGFESYPYFHLFFRKHCGETPKNFRKAFG